MNKSKIELVRGITTPMFMIFSREEVEAGDPRPAVEQWNELFADREVVWQSRNQIILVIDGYLDDPRELVEIKEVRDFLGKFNELWPYWAFFFNHVDDSIRLLFTCTCAARFYGGCEVDIDPIKANKFLRAGFSGMNAIFKTFGFPEEEISPMTRRIAEILKQTGHSGRM